MRLSLTVVSPAAGQSADVVLDADQATPVAEVAAELGRFARNARVIRLPGAVTRPATAAAGDPAPLYVDYQRVAPDLALGASPIVNGSVISIGSPDGCMVPEPTGIVEVRVAGGPGAGAVHRLGIGEAVIGSGLGAAIQVDDPHLPELALRVSVDARGDCQVTPLDVPAASGQQASGHKGPRRGGADHTSARRDSARKDSARHGGADHGGADHASGPGGGQPTLDREPLTATTPWRPGQQLAIGGTLLALARYEPPDAALHASDDGAGLDFNRPPRLLPPARVTKFALPVPPGAAEHRPLPILMAVVPVIMGVALALFMHQLYMLAMTALSPVMLIGNHISERRQGRTSHARQVAAYREHKERIEADARAALEAERLARHDECPDPAAVLSIVSGPRRRLWERRRTDPDYLLLRVGTADLPSAVELTDPELDEHRRQVFWTVPDAPVTVALRERPVLGVAGPGGSPRALGRWLLAQAASLHSPNDLRIYVLTDSSGADCWEWVRWLPHSACQPDRACALIGNDAESVAGRIADLLALITARQAALRESGAAPAAGPGPLGGVGLAGAGAPSRFEDDVVVVFDGSRKLRSLPGVIQILRDGPAVGVYSICLDADERLLPAECQAVAVVQPDGVRVQQTMALAVSQVRPDAVSAPWCERVARAMAPIRDVSDDEEAAGLPDSARLLDVLSLEPPTAQAILARWSVGGRSTLAVVGESYDGPFGIDMRKDGPHGLIAGTTGSGKSELLQTIVASLAVANRPDEFTFVLIDYKGGSAFKDCVALPHTVGMVTDLDTHQVERALTSLSAELTRREHILAGVGAKDIEDYQLLVDRQPGLARLPRLLIVIDEFASMVRELPDFVTGLVNIAQRGRSLGIHLILATQRPSGVVSGDIRANTNLRIALRVTDAGESADVIDAPDAGHIAKSTPGRAYVRLGHASLVPFQAGRVGGRRPGAAGDADAAPPWVAPVTWADLGRPQPARPAPPKAQEEEVTDLKVLVGEIQDAVAQLGIERPHSPWLPALPADLLLSQVQAGGGAPGAFGTEDLPALQLQRPAVLDLAATSHLMAAGAPRSGRSQLLRTIAGSLALAHSCADVHLYGIDCGNGALLPIADLPHCGAVVGRTQAERATRLLLRLAEELSRRQELLAERGFADITEQRAAAAPEDRLAHVFVLLDRWEGFTSTLGDLDGGKLTDVITRLLGEGASAGMHLVMTGDRTLLTGRISAMCEEKLVFKMAEKDDYGLAGLRPRDMPDEVPPGRAFRAGSGLEVQVALLAPDASGQGQAAALRSIAAACAERDARVPAAQRAPRVDVLPARITFDEAWALRPAAAGSPLWGLVGVGGDTLAALGPDLATGVPCFTVAGPGKSGRSTILASMARSFLLAGASVILVTPRPSPLRSLAAEPGVVRLFDGEDLPEEELLDALGKAAGQPCAVVIDDAEMLRDCDASGVLSRIIAVGADSGQALVFGGDSENLGLGFSGWQVDAKRARRGALIAPSTLPDGDLIGVRLSHGALGAPPRPGRALLNVGDGTLVTVTVPG